MSNFFSQVGTKTFSVILMLFCLVTMHTNAQTYFTESFESAMTNDPPIPTTFAGWTQVRMGNNTNVPTTHTASTTLATTGPRDWDRATFVSGTTWRVTRAPYYNTNTVQATGTKPGGAVDGTGALWFNDALCKTPGIAASGDVVRRIISPEVDLQYGVTPVLIFSIIVVR